MNDRFFSKSFLMLVLSLIALPVLIALYPAPAVVSAQTGATPGSLTALDGREKRARCVR